MFDRSSTDQAAGARRRRIPAATIAAALTLLAATSKGSAIGPLAALASPVELRILAPRPGETVPGPDVTVKFELKNYDLYYNEADKKGQHIHFILDNEPYLPQFSSQPFTFKNVPAGTHTIRCFPSREWHESIKDTGAFALVTFHVGKADGRNAVESGKPLLTYSRPKGEYRGEQAKRILLDFWVTNARLGTGKDECRVRAWLDGKETELTKWEPVWWENLAPGPHTVGLELVDHAGHRVPGPFNFTQRMFTIVADSTGTPAGAPAADSAHAGH